MTAKAPGRLAHASRHIRRRTTAASLRIGVASAHSVSRCSTASRQAPFSPTRVCGGCLSYRARPAFALRGCSCLPTRQHQVRVRLRALRAFAFQRVTRSRSRHPCWRALLARFAAGHGPANRHGPRTDLKLAAPSGRAARATTFVCTRGCWQLFVVGPVPLAPPLGAKARAACCRVRWLSVWKNRE